MSDNSSRLMLIEPPFYRLSNPRYSLNKLPLGLGYLAGAVRKNTSWDVCIYNSDFAANSKPMKLQHLVGKGFDNYLRQLNDLDSEIWKEIAKTVIDYNPQVVGLTAKTQNFVAATNIATIVKRINPEIKVVLGGPCVSTWGKNVLERCADIDLAVSGEGEETLVELLDKIEGGLDITQVKGTIVRDGDDCVTNAARPFIEDLDSLAYPHEAAEDCLKDYEQYPKHSFQYIFGSRGCPFNCKFCGSRYTWSRKARLRSADNVAREIALLQQKGLTHVQFDDDTFGIKPSYIIELCQAIKEQAPGITWSCEIHVNLVNDKLVSAMKDSGCNAMQVGIESGNNDILKQMRKQMKIEDAYKACDIIRKHKIHLSTFFIAGFPQETEQTLADTVTAMKRVKADRLIYSVFTPYPGTEIFDECIKVGLVDKDFDVARFNHQSPDNCFTQFIEPVRFRQLASNIERTVDRHNRMMQIKRGLTTNMVNRLDRYANRLFGKKPAQVVVKPVEVKAMCSENNRAA